MQITIIKEKEEQIRKEILLNGNICPYSGEKCICLDLLEKIPEGLCKAGLYKKQK